MGGGASGIGRQGLPCMPRSEDHREVGALRYGFAMHYLPSQDDARRHDDCELIDAEIQNLFSMP